MDQSVQALLVLIFTFFFFIVLALPWVKHFPKYHEEVKRGETNIGVAIAKMMWWYGVYFAIYAIVTEVISIATGYDVNQLISNFFSH